MIPERSDRLMGGRGREFVPATVAAVIAVVGTAAFFFGLFGPKDDIRGHGVGMITSAVAAKAGATVLPTDPAIDFATSGR